MTRRICPSAPLFVILLVFLAIPPESWSAGFGRNKVQYDKLQWHCITTRHFSVYYHQGQDELPRLAAKWAEEMYDSLSRAFSFTHRKPVPLLVYGSPSLFQQTNIIMDIVPEEVGGFTELFKNRVVLPFTGSYEDFRHVLHHELVHSFEFGVLFDAMGGAFFRSANLQIPLWFAEGLAEYLSSGWDAEADMFLMDRVVNGELPPGLDLAGYMVYKGGQSFLYYLATSRGEVRFRKFLRAFKDRKNLEAAIKQVYGDSATLESLGRQWVQELKRIYWPEIGRRQSPSDITSSIASHEKFRNHFNLRPRLSPDGTKVAYFSDRKDDTRIVIADRKGKILKEIGQYGFGGYFESFHPFRSGMCWSPNGDRIAFVTKNRGRDQLRILRTDTWRTDRVIETEVTHLTSPDWSPDGRYLVFCGLKGHHSDLFVYDLQTSTVDRLTSDKAFESDPRFAPNGGSIVYAASDSLTGNAAHIPNGSLPADLFRFDRGTRSAQRLTNSPFTEKQPCFSGDGKHLVFVSDRNGIDNLYRAALTSPDSATPVTDIIGGCSNPDWARSDSAIVYCQFQKSGWDVLLLEKPFARQPNSALTPTLWQQHCADTSVHFFKVAPDSAKRKNPADSSGSIVEEDTSTGDIVVELPRDSTAPPADTTDTAGVSQSSADTLPTGQPVADTTGATRSLGIDSLLTEKKVDTSAAARTAALPARPYRLKFSPDLVAVGLAINTLYANYGGQAMVVLSDVLGNHRITVAGDIQGDLDEYAHLYASYLSLKYRVSFGAAAFYSRDYTFQSVDFVYHDATIGGMLMTSYPFSQDMRLDFNTYYSNISRDLAFVQTAAVVDSSQEKQSLNILLPSLSLTFDNTVWGITGPLNGMRANANLLLAPPIDATERRFIAGEIDIRKYFHVARRFVWANRVAAGGSLPLGDEESARQYYLGGNENWLFTYGDIDRDNYIKSLPNAFYSQVVVPFRGWKYYGLSGSRFALLNSEFRFPFIREISVVWPLQFDIRYINGAAFIDLGNAWDPQDEMGDLPLPRDIYGGIGFGLRANLGIFVLRYDRAWGTNWRSYPTNPRSYVSLGAEF